ncbi:N-acetylmuramoyl-L-alanine amidase [Leuconostoc citreum]|uniref:N-acetylmuramoyl-L-alanine amidase n=1 Tax=Leuconostoc citreum TaxID=33964 RepID=UPI00066031FA|nr:N-acetylmuramoyl-L-alanine amidase [Leuconostoc citreum]KAF0261380.1 N-acetylmuramoyl-L-alanine amidase [Leuconostoc citreum]MBA5938497.1 N-acetylmuramoyl-L-alanine amidase [Leuconostoc citreum]MBE4725137.1 N-acetylmuramoyl-L-alanine amidase [Leuconostoc citreum]MCT3069125.1 N-acetylmuramoyl-L-alanine amidase [Leuconostoc citreum]QEA37044.1 SH3 domain-containing protein [Leuconostoc citreum]
MIKKWLLSNLIGVIITVFVLITTFGSIYTLANKDRITTRPMNVQLRTGPGIQYQSAATLKKGTNLLIMEKVRGWYKVRRTDNEKIGWVASWVAEAKTLRVATPISEATIVLDPGHGGDPDKRYDGLPGDNGSSSADGKHFEKTYTLSTAKAIRDKLQQTGARVFMTRDSDVIIPLLHIPRLTEKYQADAQISIHFDHDGDENNATSATGISQYYYHNNGKQLTEALHQSLNQLPLPNRGSDTAKYVVLDQVTRPATLLELGYINNPSDFKHIRTAAYQKEIANAVTAGLQSYFKQTMERK